MHYIVTKSRWRGRWHVYSMGHLEGDQTWLATFLNKADAFRFAGITHGTQKNGEGLTEFTMRRIRHEIVEECAKVADTFYDHARKIDDQFCDAEDFRSIARAIRNLAR